MPCFSLEGSEQIFSRFTDEFVFPTALKQLDGEAEVLLARQRMYLEEERQAVEGWERECQAQK